MFLVTKVASRQFLGLTQTNVQDIQSNKLKCNKRIALTERIPPPVQRANKRPQ